MGSSVMIGTGDGMLQIYDWPKMNENLQPEEVYEFHDEGKAARISCLSMNTRYRDSQLV